MTATDRAAHSADAAQVEAGKNVASESHEPVVVTGEGSNGMAVAARHDTHHHHSSNSGLSGHTEEELAHLRLRTQVTHEGEAYCPNPNLKDLVRNWQSEATARVLICSSIAFSISLCKVASVAGVVG